MKKFLFYFGGLVPEIWSSTLRVEENRLYGTRGGESREILPPDIVEVQEFSGASAFLLLTTVHGRFHVGALTKHYDEVVQVLERYIGSSFCRDFAHQCNVLFYRRQFRVMSFLRSLLRDKKGDAVRFNDLRPLFSSGQRASQ